MCKNLSIKRKANKIKNKITYHLYPQLKQQLIKFQEGRREAKQKIDFFFLFKFSW